MQESGINCDASLEWRKPADKGLSYRLVHEQVARSTVTLLTFVGVCFLRDVKVTRQSRLAGTGSTRYGASPVVKLIRYGQGL